MSRILVLFDESGDLGWKLDAPYRAGGSSRYFVVASALGHDRVHRTLGKIVRKLWSSQGWSSGKEKKWKDMPNGARLKFAHLVVQHVTTIQPGIRLSVAVLDKLSVAKHLRHDHHLLYAHLATQLVADDLAASETAEVCPDELNQGAGAANLLQHLMRHEVWFRRGCSPSIRQIARAKHLTGALEFCDMLAGAAASHFEDGRSEPWSALQQVVSVRHGC